MELEIRSRYHEGILRDAMRRYRIAPDQIDLLDGFESYVYLFERDGREYVLRIGHSRRRTPALIQGEVEWLNHLADGGASVARAVHSEAGRLVEAIDDGRGGQFLTTAFVRAQGRPVWEVGWTPALHEAYGRLLGRIHALSKTYTPSDPAIRRHDWNHPQNLDVLQWLPASEPVLIEKFEQVTAYLQALPSDERSFGLIHQDPHSANFFVTDQGQITLFDFDDCVYSWYVYDLAMVVFYMVATEPDPVGLMEAFWPRFWTGYQAENRLDPSWLAEIPWFLKLREIDTYAMCLRSYGGEQEVDNPWLAKYLDGRKARIVGDVPLVRFNFTR
jgi:Ser/Thr protein kinase RdoA (MazF antagonist)